MCFDQSGTLDLGGGGVLFDDESIEVGDGCLGQIYTMVFWWWETQRNTMLEKRGEKVRGLGGNFDVLFLKFRDMTHYRFFQCQRMNISIPRTKSYMKNSEMIWANYRGQTAGWSPPRAGKFGSTPVYPPEPRMPVTHLNLQFVTGKLHVLPGCDLRLHRIRLESHRSGLGCRSRARVGALKKWWFQVATGSFSLQKFRSEAKLVKPWRKAYL